MPEYLPFDLPFCVRCTKVIVDSINEFIKNAKEKGYLKGRIDKSYRYFENKEKDQESEKYPYINYSQIFVNRIPWFIEYIIGEIAKELKQKFLVLIITPYRIQAQMIVNALKDK